jgi:hypothetical protein
MKTDMTNTTSLQHVLDTYCANSGQMVSLVKSSIFFSPNTNALITVKSYTLIQKPCLTSILDPRLLWERTEVTAFYTLWKKLSKGLMGGKKNFYPLAEKRSF